MKRRQRGRLALGMIVMFGLGAAWLWRGELTGWLPFASRATDGAAEYTAGPFHVGVTFDPDPPRTGRNTLTLSVHEAGGAPVDGATITATATMPAMSTMPEMRSEAETTELEKGSYRLALRLSTAGSWPLSVHIHAQDGREADLNFYYATGVPVRLADASAGSAEAGGGAAGIAYNSCSMHPSIRSKVPGKCPICSMDLVPVTHKEVEEGTIHVDAARRQVIGVKTGRVERKKLVINVRAVGRITYDETQLVDISTKYKGWIGTVFADYTGIQVEKGKPLFTIYSPELLSAQEEFLESQRRVRANPQRDRAILHNARRRLRLWDLTAAQISQLAESGKSAEYVPILSPVSGTVIEKNVYDGSAVESGMLLYRVADLSTVWVEADIYESDLPLVELGQTARVTLSYLPGDTFTGTVSYVYPYLDAPTRTGRIRLEVPNPTGTLKPDMYVNIALQIPQGEQLIVPEEAVVMAGETNLVFLDLGGGHLKPQKIEIGRKGPDGYVVLDGLSEGDKVVTSGTFLIAAESKLKTGIDKW